MTNNITEIDSTNALVNYVNSIKPFHTKIAEIFIGYNYTEEVTVAITEKLQITINLLDSEYMFNVFGSDEESYGIVWDSMNVNPELLTTTTFTESLEMFFDDTPSTNLITDFY